MRFIEHWVVEFDIDGLMDNVELFALGASSNEGLERMMGRNPGLVHLQWANKSGQERERERERERVKWRASQQLSPQFGRQRSEYWHAPSC